MKELELTDKFCNYLGKIEISYQRELWKGRSQGYIDIAIKNKKNQLIAIEVKIGAVQQVLFQASVNKLGCDFSYILLPKIPSKKHLDNIQRRGLGLIIPFEREFKVMIKPKIFNFIYDENGKIYNLKQEKFAKKWQYNFDNNKAGRTIREREKYEIRTEKI